MFDVQVIAAYTDMSAVWQTCGLDLALENHCAAVSYQDNRKIPVWVRPQRPEAANQ